MKITASQLKTPRLVRATAMENGDLGVVVSPDFKGEVMLYNVAGWHCLTVHRYWPSQYILDQQKGNRGAYVPDFTVQLLEVGDSLAREAGAP
jgi:hypothetical protein